jgi:hypothetical protein
MYVKKYVVRDNPNHVKRKDLNDVFVRSANPWKLKISKTSPFRRDQRLSSDTLSPDQFLFALQRKAAPHPIPRAYAWRFVDRDSEFRRNF